MADRIYPASMEEAIPDPKRVKEVRRELESKGVKYLLINWIDLLGQPKTKPTPLSELEEWCEGRGPQFAVHSVSMVPERGPADPDQIPIPDLDSLVICPWDGSCA
ncbi:MAG: hypothetical protein OXC14_10365, partial [Rhodospirillaceae bacterium]|nr:hypothetical protein [Rhodospirillaceae bacterium]